MFPFYLKKDEVDRTKNEGKQEPIILVESLSDICQTTRLIVSNASDSGASFDNQRFNLMARRRI